MKRAYAFFLTVLMVILLTIASVAQNTDDKMEINIRAETAGVLQALRHDNDANTLSDVPNGIQSAVGNIMVDAKIVNGIDVFFEVYLSSNHHEGYLMDREGFIYVSRLPDEFDILGINNMFKYIDFKAGHFEVDFGNWHYIRSDNGEVQRNPLIGNYIVDVNTVEPGIEVIGHHGILNWVAGVSTGTTTGDFKEGRGTALHGKVGLDLPDSFNAAASIYRVDHSDNPTGYPNKGSYSSMFAGNRSGGRYAGILGGGPEPGQVKPGKGQDITAWQIDALWKINPLTLSGLYGFSEDADINGSEEGKPVEEWIYYGIEAKYDFSSKYYAVARYNAAKANKYNNVDSEGKVDRIQLGAGVWIAKSMLLKMEYVNQRYNDFKVSDLQYNPGFSGVVTEVSVGF